MVPTRLLWGRDALIPTSPSGLSVLGPCPVHEPCCDWGCCWTELLLAVLPRGCLVPLHCPSTGLPQQARIWFVGGSGGVKGFLVPAVCWRHE